MTTQLSDEQAQALRTLELALENANNVGLTPIIVQECDIPDAFEDVERAVETVMRCTS